MEWNLLLLSVVFIVGCTCAEGGDVLERRLIQMIPSVHSFTQVENNGLKTSLSPPTAHQSQFPQYSTIPVKQKSLDKFELKDALYARRNPVQPPTVRPAVPNTHRKKSMDGWIPMGLKNLRKPDPLVSSEARIVPIKIEKAVEEKSYHRDFKVDMTTRAPPAPAPVPPASTTVTTPMLHIHAHNVIINPDTASRLHSTPQISADLRDRFRALKNSPTMNTIAQSLRQNRLNNVDEMEISIPHKFKMKKPLIVDTVRMQATSASFPEPQVTYGVPTEQGQAYGAPQESPAQSYGPPSQSYSAPSQLSIPRIRPTPGLLDYGEGVKYVQKGPQILQAQSQGYGGESSSGASLNQIASELEEKLRELVRQEVQAQGQQLQQAAPTEESGQYGPPGVVEEEPQQEYGAPGAGEPQQEYGAPGIEPGQPIGQEYGPPSGPQDGGEQEVEYETHSEIAPPQHKPLFNLQLPAIFSGHGHEEQVELLHNLNHDLKEELKEKLTVIGKNLFYSALDFSRVYNPITLIEKLKNADPVIKFVISDPPRKHRKKKKKGRRHHHHKHHHHHHHGWKRRSS